MDCLFCKIINGDIPCNKLYEDDLFFVFLDLDQSTEGHALIVPKEHIEDYKALSSEMLIKMYDVAKHVSDTIMKELGKTGVSLLFNYGTNQDIKHVHMHVLPKFLKETSEKSQDEIYELLKGKF